MKRAKIRTKKTQRNMSEFQELRNAIRNSIEHGDFNWDTFFRLWFRNGGTPWFFLFKKSLSVTNVQFVELFRLLQIYSTSNWHVGTGDRLLFYPTEKIKSTFSEAVDSLIEGSTEQKSFDQNLDFFCSHYAEVFYSTCSVDTFFGSCAVFTPPGVNIDLEKVVGDSGYIHSAGKSIYIRNIGKSKRNDFLSAVESYIEEVSATCQADLPVPFVVYAHEDFSGHDKNAADLLSRGIENSKIFVEKMNMGSHRLTTIVDDLQKSEKFRDKLLIPEAGPYTTKHTFQKNRTLWLISDKSLSGGTTISNPGADRYYICYEQAIKSESPFYFFDENKPAWKSHTTLPHTLTGALINVARPIGSGQTPAICDPFCGTGTTWLEAKRLGFPALLRCSDLSAAAQLLLQDNIQFFLMTAPELETLVKQLEPRGQRKARQSPEASLDFGATASDPTIVASEFISELKAKQPDEDQEFELSDDFIRRLKGRSFLERLYFYVALRAELRFQGGYARHSVDFAKAFTKSMKQLLEQIHMLLKLRHDCRNLPSVAATGSSVLISDTYSRSVVPSLIFRDLESLNAQLATEVYSGVDATELPENSLDLILCDPPYGFNTTEDEVKLAKLYSSFLDNAIKSLRSSGQLIICLPGESYTGRNLPYCTRADLILRQVLVKARNQNRLIYPPVRTFPHAAFGPPYYWESERALRRVVLHFRFG